uniref:Uncharacterized protein n=1 Tax=Rhizophora mucronata TaxID=61149 RepID=A0A2P2MY69_RHIMU
MLVSMVGLVVLLQNFLVQMIGLVQCKILEFLLLFSHSFFYASICNYFLLRICWNVG